MLLEMANEGHCDQKTGETARQRLKAMAEKGNAASQYYMGLVNERGLTIPINLRDTMFWYKKAASKGYNSAYIRIGQMYESGSGVTQNYINAKKAYETAVENGDFTANWNIARLHETGSGVAKSQEAGGRENSITIGLNTGSRKQQLRAMSQPKRT